MAIEQLSVFLGNRPGRILNVCRLLGDNDIDIKALSIAENKDYGVLRLIVDKLDLALKVLKDASFTAECTKVVAVEVPNVPGGLAQVLEAIDKARLNVEYMYGFSMKHSDNALMVFRFEDPKKASEALAAAGIGIVAELR